MGDIENKNPLNLFIVSADAEVANALYEEVCAEELISEGMTRVNGCIVCVDVLVGSPAETPSFRHKMAQAGALLVGVRHIDMVSLEALRTVMAGLEGLDIPVGVVILRNDAETDFKMSCVYCGQKLWVMDSDVDKRGRCPNCKKAFTLPAQNRMLRVQLKLPDSLPVQIVYKGNPFTTRGVVANLVGSTDGDIFETEDDISPETLKKSTVRVQIQDVEDPE